MTFTDRLFASVAAVIAGVAAMMSAAPVQAASTDPVQSLQQTYAAANAALLRGDVAEWASKVPLSKDFVLFSPFGGTPSRYADYTPARIERMGRFFKNGRDHRQEIVETFATRDMIVLATIERDHVEVGGLPGQNWALRVTSVFKREGSRWVLAHRHADPLVADVPLLQAAQIARGERSATGK
jgi:ketosteroid isomerase-like protein